MKSKLILLAAISLLGVHSQAIAERTYYGASLCGHDGFTCVKIKRTDSWEKMFPDPTQRELVKRLNRTSIPLFYRSWIVVPDNLNEVSYMDLAPFPDRIEPRDKKLIVVDLRKAAFGAYNPAGQLVHWGPISGGQGYCPDVAGNVCNTATGSFILFDKKGPDCKSAVFPVETSGGAPMPFCMYFLRGFALHGSTLPGFHASHGCVRLFTEDAKWLNRNFVDVGTRVIVRK